MDSSSGLQWQHGGLESHKHRSVEIHHRRKDVACQNGSISNKYNGVHG